MLACSPSNEAKAGKKKGVCFRFGYRGNRLVQPYSCIPRCAACARYLIQSNKRIQGRIVMPLSENAGDKAALRMFKGGAFHFMNHPRGAYLAGLIHFDIRPPDLPASIA